MSSTNRGGEREDLDGYWTPPACAHAIVKRLYSDRILKPSIEGIEDRLLVLEPSVGKGSFVRALLAEAKPEDLWIDACDLVRRPELDGLPIAEFYEQDFLTLDPETYFDLVIGNPPFNDAERHVRHSLKMIDPHNGTLAFILRLSFLEGVKRQAYLWKEHPPQYIYVLDKRPSFTVTIKQAKDKETGALLFKKDGSPLMKKTANDSASYGVFVWKNGMLGHEPVVRFLSWSM